MAKRRRKGGDHEGNHERWLLTYSDMITLLMAFFIMMYSMSVLNLQKFHEVAISIRSGFGGMLTGKGGHLLDKPAGLHASILPFSKSGQQQLKEMRKRLNSTIIMNNVQDKVKVTQEARGIVISMVTDDLLFPTGSAELSPSAYGLLTEISADIEPLANDILVEGHTDPRPIATALYPSNWELSAARASRVLRVLLSSGIHGERLSAVGYADTRPVAPNDSDQHRQLNRRVDIVILNTEAVQTSVTSEQANPKNSIAHEKPSVKPNAPDVHPQIPKVVN